MKTKLFFIVVILLLLSVLHSCGTSKKAQIVDKVVVTENVTDSVNSIAVTEQNLITTADLSLEGVEIIHVVYDTNIRSPSDKQKIVSKTSYKRYKRNNIQVDAVHDSASICTRRERNKAIITDSVHVVKSKEKKETEIPRQIGELTRWVCVVFGLIIVRYIMRRYGRK